MSVNPDIEETRIFIKLAKEFVEVCQLEDIAYSETDDHYALLYVFAEASQKLQWDELMKRLPCMCDAMTAIDNQVRRFDWPSLALAVDHLRGTTGYKFETS